MKLHRKIVFDSTENGQKWSKNGENWGVNLMNSSNMWPYIYIYICMYMHECMCMNVYECMYI